MEGSGTSADIKPMQINNIDSEFIGPCSIFHRNLYKMRQKQLLCDVTIVDDDNGMTCAHALVLSCASDALHRALTLTQSFDMIRKQGLALKIGGISVSTWELLLDYIYLGRINAHMSQEAVQSLYNAAAALNVPHLANALCTRTKGTSGVDIETGIDKKLEITIAPFQVDTECHTTQILDEHTCTNNINSQKKQRLKESHEDYVSTPCTEQTHNDQEKNENVNSATSNFEATANSATSGMSKSTTCIYCHTTFRSNMALLLHVAGKCKNRPPANEKQDNDNYDENDEEEYEQEMRLLAEAEQLDESASEAKKEKAFMCFNLDCNEEFPDQQMLLKHLIGCILSETSYRVYDYYEVSPDGHLRYNDGKFELSEGGIEFPTAEIIQSEFFRNKKVGSRSYHCSHCDRVVRLSKIKEHLAVTHGKRKPLHCKFCNFRCGYLESARSHYLRVHTDVGIKKRLPCRTCGEVFPTFATRRTHETKHLPVDKRRTRACTVCEKSFERASDLRVHMNIHEGVKIKCQVCDYTSTRKGNVRKHERNSHGISYGQYVCGSCGNSYVSRTWLRVHLENTGHQRTMVHEESASVDVPTPDQSNQAEVAEVRYVSSSDVKEVLMYIM